MRQRGTVDHTPVYPRVATERALPLTAPVLILVHNHPSGDPKPLREIKGIAIHDHLVIGREGHASFRSLQESGLLS